MNGIPPSPEPYLFRGGFSEACRVRSDAWSSLCSVWDTEAGRQSISAAAITGIPRAAQVLEAEPSPLASLVAEAATAARMTMPMAREALRNLLGGLDEKVLCELRAAVSAQSAALNTRKRLVVGHVLAGNLFLSGIESMIMASLAGACSVVRTSSTDRLFPLVWLEALRLGAPTVAETVAVGWWPSDESALTSAVFRQCDRVAIYGSDETLNELRSLVPGKDCLIEHGTALSYAVVLPGAAEPEETERTAAALAYDFSVYDQQGCLSPRAVFVLGGDESAHSIATTLLKHMRAVQRRLPRHDLTLPEKAELARARYECLMATASGEPGGVLSAPDDPFLVTLRPCTGYALGALNRHVDIRAADAQSVVATLRPFAGRIATIGIAGRTVPGAAEVERLLMASLSPGRICDAGDMQRPPPGWTHGGKLTLGDPAKL